MNPKQADSLIGGFAEFEWISKENYQGTVEINGQRYHHYKQTSVLALDPDEPISKMKGASNSSAADQITFRYEAWINASTLLPFAFEDNGVRREYEFKDAGIVQLELPADFVNAAKAIDPSFSAK